MMPSRPPNDPQVRIVKPWITVLVVAPYATVIPGKVSASMKVVLEPFSDFSTMPCAVADSNLRLLMKTPLSRRWSPASAIANFSVCRPGGKPTRETSRGVRPSYSIFTLTFVLPAATAASRCWT